MMTPSTFMNRHEKNPQQQQTKLKMMTMNKISWPSTKNGLAGVQPLWLVFITTCLWISSCWLVNGQVPRMEDRLSSSSSADVPINYYYIPMPQEIIQTNNVANTVAILSPVLKAVRSVLTHPGFLSDTGLFLIGQGTIVLPALRSAKWIVFVSRRYFPTIVGQMIRRWGSATRRSSRLVMAMRQHKRIRNIGKTLQCMYKNRSRISVLSDYTWYYNTSSSPPGE